MKRVTLISRIAVAAAAANKNFSLLREGGNHSIFRCGSQNVAVPRHSEINERTARGIMRDLEQQLGEGWWK